MKLKRNEYLQLAGLLSLAKPHNDALEDIRRSVGKLVGDENDDAGHVSDAVYAHFNADELLRKLSMLRKHEAKAKKK